MHKPAQSYTAKWLTSLALYLPLAAMGSLQQDLDDIRQANGISALYLITLDAGEAHHLALGSTSHKETGEPLAGIHTIRIGSISKLFLGLSVLRLEAAGHVDQDKPLRAYVQDPPFDNPWKDTHPVTLAQLIEHTAGFTDMSQPEWNSKEPLSLEAAFTVDPGSRKLRWPAGLHVSYTNTGAGIAAYAIEQATGRDFEEVVRKEVFDLLQLDSATYQPTPAVRATLVTGYNTDGRTEIPYWHTLYRAFGGINIQAGEMEKVLRFLVNGGGSGTGQLIPTADFDRLVTPRTSLAAVSGLRYGYGLGLYHFHGAGQRWIGHGGDADGYLTYLAWMPEHDRGYFLFINAFNNRVLRQMRRLVQQHLGRDLESVAPPPVYSLTPDQLLAFTGTYESVTWRFQPHGPVTLGVENGRLMRHFNNRSREIIPVTPQHFRYRNEPDATIAIVRHGEMLYFQSDEGNFARILDKD